MRTKAGAGWHKEDIKAAIRKRGSSLDSLSRTNGMNRQACSSALFRPNYAAELVIAAFLGVSPQELWPHRYNENGTYRHPLSQTHYARMTGPGERKIGDAA